MCHRKSLTCITLKSSLWKGQISEKAVKYGTIYLRSQIILNALFQLRVQCNHLPSDIQELVTGPPHDRTDVSYVCMLSEVCNPKSYPAVPASQHWKLPDDTHLWVLVYSSGDILTPGTINTTVFTGYYKEELQAHACMHAHTHTHRVYL